MKVWRKVLKRMEMKRKFILVIAAIAICIMAGRIFAADYPIASTKAVEKKQTVSITLNKPVYTLKKGRTVKLKATLNKAAKKKGVEWKSSKPRVASVSRNGKVTAKRNGKATITVRVKGTKVKASSRITVGTPISKIKLNRKFVSLKAGQKFSLKTTIFPKKASVKKLFFKSSNGKVTTVDKRGVIWAISAGTAKITATAADGSGKKVSCIVKVSESAVPDVPRQPEEPDKPKEPEKPMEPDKPSVSGKVTEDTTVSEIINDPAFGDFGRLLFPVDRTITGDMTLEEISSSSVYTWYSNIKADKTVEIVNDLKARSEEGEQIFHQIYSEEEMKADPEKRDTGLFYFKGKPGAKYAILNAGGGFAYVGAMHDSFPHALEVSRKGYHAFALIYRPDSAYEDLARAIAYVNDHAKELGVDSEGYSLWGGSAGARMAATLGNKEYGPANYGRKDIPQAAAVIMQYTGYANVSASDAPTYACVGTRDGIADYRTMESRLAKLNSLGIPTEFHAYEGLGHGFGLGTGTVAEGWIEDALAFWEAQAGTQGAKEKNTLLTASPTPDKQQTQNSGKRVSLRETMVQERRRCFQWQR